MEALQLNMGRRGQVLLAFAVAFATAGCTNLSGLGGTSEFQCKAPEGIPCQSVSGVHINERAGNLPAQRATKGEAATQSDTEARRRAAGWAGDGGMQPRSTPVTVAVRPAPTPYQRTTTGGPERLGPNGFGAIRSEPTVIRMWVAPWEDADGDLNDQTYVYMQVDSGRWLIEHNRAAIRREFAPRSATAAVQPRSSQVAVAAAQAPVQAPMQEEQAGPSRPVGMPPDIAAAIRRAAERGAAQGAAGPGAAQEPGK